MIALSGDAEKIFQCNLLKTQWQPFIRKGKLEATFSLSVSVQSNLVLSFFTF